MIKNGYKNTGLFNSYIGLLACKIVLKVEFEIE